MVVTMYLVVCMFASWWTYPGRSILWRSSRPCTEAQSNLSPKCRDEQKREPEARNRVRRPATEETINLVNFLWKCQDILFLETFGKYLNVKHMRMGHAFCGFKPKFYQSCNESHLYPELDWSDIGNLLSMTWYCDMLLVMSQCLSCPTWIDPSLSHTTWRENTFKLLRRAGKQNKK